MHYWRIPVPELWIDILQKVKAAGYWASHFRPCISWGSNKCRFNTVSFYSNWGETPIECGKAYADISFLGYHSASDGSLDFESGSHDFTRLFDLAKVRPIRILFGFITSQLRHNSSHIPWKVSQSA